MGFDWDFDRTEKGVNGGYKGIAKDNVLFKARIAQLAEVNEKFGDCNDINVMRAAGHPETSQLYQWLKRQRKAWKSLKAGQWSWLDAERIAMLESIKINWEPYKHRLPYGAKKAAAAAAASEQGGAAANPDGAVAGQGATNGHGANTHHPNAAGDMDDDSSDEDVDDDDEEEEEDNTFHHLHHHDRYRT